VAVVVMAAKQQDREREYPDPGKGKPEGISQKAAENAII